MDRRGRGFGLGFGLGAVGFAVVVAGALSVALLVDPLTTGGPHILRPGSAAAARVSRTCHALPRRTPYHASRVSSGAWCAGGSSHRLLSPSDTRHMAWTCPRGLTGLFAQGLQLRMWYYAHGPGWCLARQLHCSYTTRHSCRSKGVRSGIRSVVALYIAMGVSA